MDNFRFGLPNTKVRPGKTRRKEFERLITDDNISFPNTVSITDIDHAFEEFVKNDLEIEYGGKVLPTYNSMSNQRLSMYAQTWQYTDEANNVLLNFKVFNRNVDVKKGTISGDIYNIPGHRDYVLGYKAVRQENMLVGYDVYTVKEPTAVDLSYKLNIVTNNRELLSKFSEKVLYHFNGFQAFLYPRGHAMSMRLTDVIDESEYSIDDRKFYSQGFDILVKGYFLDESNFIITHRPIRVNLCLTAGSEIYLKGNADGDQVTLTVTGKGDENTCSFRYNRADKLVLQTLNLNNIDNITMFVNEEQADLEADEVIIEPDDSIRFDYTPVNTIEGVLIQLTTTKKPTTNE